MTKRGPQAVAVLNILKLITESSDSEQHHRHSKKKSRKPGSQEGKTLCCCCFVQGPRLFFSFFLSFYTIHCVFSFKSSPFFPIFGNVDPIIVVLNPSFDWFFIFLFLQVFVFDCDQKWLDQHKRNTYRNIQTTFLQ